MTSQRLLSRVALITGGSSGIGAATAHMFAKEGAQVLIADLRSGGTEASINSTYGSDRAKFITCDVRNEKQVRDAVEAAVTWGGRLDILCNIAGVVVESKYKMKARCHEISVDEYDVAMAVNARGAWMFAKYALTQMLKQQPLGPNARGEMTRGWIVNMSSIAGVVGCLFTPAYTPTKHAIIGMTKQMAIDYAEQRIHVNAVCPGYIKTPQAAFALEQEGGEQTLASRAPWNSMGLAEDCASAVLFLSSSEAYDPYGGRRVFGAVKDQTV